MTSLEIYLLVAPLALAAFAWIVALLWPKGGDHKHHPAE
jgi:hypothetical protein